VNCSWDDYASSTNEPHSTSLVVRNIACGFETPGDGWIALHPWIGRELGWHLDGSGLFRWLDDNGNRMVETIWWVDGTLAQCEHAYERDEVGEGEGGGRVAWDGGAPGLCGLTAVISTSGTRLVDQLRIGDSSAHCRGGLGNTHGFHGFRPPRRTAPAATARGPYRAGTPGGGQGALANRNGPSGPCK
jgi:hypothetical protein